MAGKKNSMTDKKNKPRLSLIPNEALFQMGSALTYGEDKYGTFNFKKGIKLSYLLDAAMRHISQFNNGEDNDLESGHSHLGHALANLAMCIDTHKNLPMFDDRYKANAQQPSKTGEVLLPEVKVQTTEMTIEEDAMMYIQAGATLYKLDGRIFNVDTAATFPVREGDWIVYASQI